MKMMVLRGVLTLETLLPLRAHLETQRLAQMFTPIYLNADVKLGITVSP